MKHKLKLFLRNAYARVLFHTGLHAVVNGIMPRRWTILAGHCVGGRPGPNDVLAPDMVISGPKLERILRWFARRYDVVTVQEGAQRMAAGGKKSLLSLSMDDGYRDNVEALLPLCREVGVPATVYLESRPLDERRVNWTHKFFWILTQMDPEAFVLRFTELSDHEATNIELNQLVPEGRANAYHIKRLLKYEVPAEARRAALDALFQELGGDERALCDSLYMDWDGARALRDAGHEVGGHTVNHEILSRLDDSALASELTGCEEALSRELGLSGVTFAYPFGRRWDYDDKAREAVRRSGFTHAVTTHAGTNDGRTDVTELKRLMIDDDAQLHLLVCEACGGFDLLRRLGLNWSE